MLRFLETFAQISFLAILLRQKQDVVKSHRPSPGSFSSSQPSCLVSFTSVFHLLRILSHFLLLDRKGEKEKRDTFSGNFTRAPASSAK